MEAQMWREIYAHQQRGRRKGKQQKVLSCVLCQVPVHVPIVANPEKFTPKPKKVPRPFTDPQAEADSEVFIPYLSDLD